MGKPVLNFPQQHSLVPTEVWALRKSLRFAWSSWLSSLTRTYIFYGIITSCPIKTFVRLLMHGEGWAQDLSRPYYRYTVCHRYGLSDVEEGLSSGGSFYHIHCIYNAAPRSAFSFSVGQQSPCLGGSRSRMETTGVVSLPCEFFDAQWGLSYSWNFSHIQGIWKCECELPDAWWGWHSE